MWLRERQGDSITDDRRVWIIIGAAAGALFGSRVLGALEDPSKLMWDMRALFVAFNNRTVVGGLLGGLAGVEVAKLLMGERHRSGDLFVFPLLLGMVVGRVGCLLGGLEDNTYGIPTELPWAMDLGDGVRRHPTNAYEIIYLALIAMVLFLLQHHTRLKSGALFQVFLASYLLFRFFIEFIKPQPLVVLGLSSIQLACIAGLLYYWRVWLTPASLKAADEVVGSP